MKNEGTIIRLSNENISIRLRNLGRTYELSDSHLSERYKRAAESVEKCPVQIYLYYQEKNQLPPTITHTSGIEGLLRDFLETLNEGARNGRVGSLDSNI